MAGVARSYDANGNTTGRGDNARYTYSDANRLAEVCQPLACPASGSTHYRYFYDGRGQRALKQKVTAHGALTTTAFTYDEGGRLVYEVGSAGGTAYVYLDQVPVGVVTGGQLYYIETDQLGTPRQVVANTSNALRWSWDYFGTGSGKRTHTFYSPSLCCLPGTSICANTSSAQWNAELAAGTPA